MQLIISDIQHENDSVIVYGMTEIGVIKGIWKYKEAPVLCKPYSVELSFKEFYKQISVKQDKNVYAEIRVSDNTVYFCGMCEDIDGDLYYVRFANDWLEMVEISEICDKVEKGDCVSFSVKYDSILIYPY